MEIPKFVKLIGDRMRAKSYVGLLNNSVPISSKQWGQGDYLRALDISLYTNRAIAKRSDKVGEIEFTLKDKNDNDVTDPMIDLLYKPNAVFTGRKFWGLYQTYYDVYGETYIYLDRAGNSFGERAKVNAMHLLDPSKMKPYFSKEGTPEKYEYKSGSGTINYTPEQILYIHNPDPAQPLRGRSLLRAGVTSIQTESQINLYHSRVLENGGKVEGAFKFKTGPLTEEQLHQIKDRYQKEYGQAKKSGMPLFLGGDAEYLKIGMTPDELSFLEAKKMTLEDICIMTGVPKSLLASTNDVKFDNADADREIFLRETIHPLLVNLTSALDELLFPDGRNLSFVDPTPENIDRKVKETESGIKNYYMTINEARERHGLDAIEGGDEIMIPFNLMALGDSNPTLTEEQKKKIFANIKQEPVHPLADPQRRKVYHQMQIKRMDKREQPFKRDIREYFDGQRDRIIEKLQPPNTRIFRKKDLLDDIMQIELEVKLGRKQFLPLVTELLRQAGVDAMELAGSTYEFNLTDSIRTWLDQRTAIFMRKINETTFKELKGQFEDSLAAGEGREALIKRVQETYKGVNKFRAGMIARTEVHNATQNGTLEGYKQAGFSIKIWVSVLDGATRGNDPGDGANHIVMDGEERPIGQVFSNGLMVPGETGAPASEVINCRCVI
jgi:HK97 family phage portal protein